MERKGKVTEKNRAKDAILRGFDAYSRIAEKNIHYVYGEDSKYQEIVVHANKSNYMHLCGVKYFSAEDRKIVNGLHFYSLLESRNISSSDIIQKRDGSTDQKLQVVDALDQLTTCNALRIINKKTVFLNFAFTAGIRSRKKIFCLALENIKGVYVPVSLLNMKREKNQISKGLPVQCIYEYDKDKQIKILSKTEEFATYESKHPYVYDTGPVIVTYEPKEGTHRKTRNKYRGPER